MHCELLVPILLQSEVKLILKMSLVFPELFDESMWRRLCPSWGDYYFLFSDNPRKRFVEIAQRKCIIPVSCPLKQIYLAILNKRKDILEECCKNHPNIARDVLRLGSMQTHIYFNRPMYNFLCRCLGEEPRERAKIISGESPNTMFDIALLETYFPIQVNPDRNLLERLVLSIYEEIREEYICLYDLVQMAVLFEDRDVEFVPSKDNIEFWLEMYSRSQKKHVLERLLEQIEKDDIRLGKEDTLCRLYASNNVRLARKYEKKFHKLPDNSPLANLAIYYVNTGDNRGLYESVLYLERKGMIRAKPVCHRLIFDLDFPEINLIMERCGVKGPNEKC